MLSVRLNFPPEIQRAKRSQPQGDWWMMGVYLPEAWCQGDLTHHGNSGININGFGRLFLNGYFYYTLRLNALHTDQSPDMG